MNANNYRIERDSMGEMQVPADAYWGAQTQRAVENFPVSGIRFPDGFIRVLGMVKQAAAKANMELKLLDAKRGDAIVQASQEVMDGRMNDQFVVDIFQTGSGTSTNMNANEVIANRANEILGSTIGGNNPVHPNDHVNMGQSSNDIIPTCIHISAAEGTGKRLLPALETLEKSLHEKVEEFSDIVKIGRTHFQDATPIRLGQEISGYESMVHHAHTRIRTALQGLYELAVGGTAVGTGINTHKDFARLVIREVNRTTGLPFIEAENHFAAQGSKDALVFVSSALKTAAVGLMKISNDIRFLSSGPRCGIGELVLPAVQPGSSIMPGKVNPVIAESLCQVAAQVIGNDSAVTTGGLLGHLELNVMMPIMAHNTLQSIEILSNAVRNFAEKCISGIEANTKRIESMIEQSLAHATALSPRIGYDEAARIAKEAYKTGKTVREIATKKGVLPTDELDEVLDPRRMTERS
jgi:fumarate hydratase class II